MIRFATTTIAAAVALTALAGCGRHGGSYHRSYGSHHAAAHIQAMNRRNAEWNRRQAAEREAQATDDGAATPVAAGGLPAGVYNCHGLGQNALFAVVRRVEIQGPSNYVLHTYNDREALPGAYSYDNGRVRWLSGPLAGTRDAEYGVEQGSAIRDPLLVFWETPVTAFRCYLSS